MVQEPARRAHKHRASFPKPSLFFLGVLAAHDRAADDKMEQFQQLLQLEVDLDAEFPCWTEDDAVSSLVTGYQLFCDGVVV